MAPTTYQDRRTKGLYDRVVDRAKCDPRSLAVLKPRSLFAARGTPWGGSKTTTRFYTSRYHSRDTEATVVLIGEVLGPEDGTAMGALGGFKLHEGWTINDQSIIKDTIAIGLPTMASKKLEDFWKSQITTLDEVYAMGINAYPEKSNWVNGRGNTAAITLMLGRKYYVPATEEEPDSKRQKLDEDDRMDTIDTSQQKAEKSVEGRPGEDSISLNSDYAPSVLNDFDSTVMCFENARLAQQNLLDVHDKLVPPWDAQKKFRKGTLVLVEAQLNVHHFPPVKKRSEMLPGRSAYQIVLSKAKVLAPSPDPFDETVLHLHHNAFEDLADIVDSAGDSSASSADEVHKTLKLSSDPIENPPETTEGTSEPIKSSPEPMEGSSQTTVGSKKRHHK